MMAQADNKYIELQKKIEQARMLDYTIVKVGVYIINPYEIGRQKVVEQYFEGNYDEQGKKYLLDLFDNYNNTLKLILGL